VNGAALIGGRALIVNAIDDEAAGFWRRRGFLPSKDDALVLFRSIADIAASLRVTDLGSTSEFQSRSHNDIVESHAGPELE
jgi:hypothetical protein